MGILIPQMRNQYAHFTNLKICKFENVQMEFEKYQIHGIPQYPLIEYLEPG